MSPTLTRAARPRRRSAAYLALAVAGVTALAACGGGSGFEDDTAADPDVEGTDGTAGGGEAGEPAGEVEGAELTILIASSGDAETNYVTEAASAWAEENGASADVVVANDINQQLAQGFAGGSPPDVFYVDAGRFADYAAAGNLYPYADQVEDFDDFYEPLRETFTFDGQTYCAPKDFSTLALQINTASWEAAGLTDDDIPTTWEELQTVADTLTTDDQAGLVIGGGRDRVGAFLVQNGGWWVDSETQEATADTPENAEALQYAQDLLSSGSAVLPPQVDSGWGGEAFGTERAAMTMEGNWIRGAMENDYPDVEYTVAELPEGPAGPGTLLFTQCWGISADSDNQAAAVSLVESLTTVESQLAAADAFGVMPSRASAEEQYVEQFPDDAPFVAGGEYGQGPVNLPGLEATLQDLDSQLEGIASTDPQQILQSFQTNAEAALGG